LIGANDIAELKSAVLATDLSIPALVRTAWASAASYRDTDMRGGANGARINLAPQNQWAVNDPEELGVVLSTLEQVQSAFNNARSDVQVSLADVIVLAGAAAIEEAAADAGYNVNVPFVPGRGDTTQELTDVQSFNVLEPQADAFRNFYEADAQVSPAEAMVDKADLLALTVPEMAVLVGGMRALGANAAGTELGVLTDRPRNAHQ
jgi:catalase-peroxidase